MGPNFGILRHSKDAHTFFPNGFSTAYAAPSPIGVFRSHKEGTMRRASYALVAFLAIATFVRHAPADDREDDDQDGSDQLQLVEATLPQLSHALRSHLVTSEQLVQMYQARIAAYDKVGPTLNAVLHLNEHALDDARAVDRERRHGDDKGPMFGI